MRTFSHCAAVRRIERCSSFSSAGFGGLPIGFFVGSMPRLSVIQYTTQESTLCDTVKPMKTLKTLKLRIKDKHANVLRQMAREVNTTRNLQ